MQIKGKEGEEYGGTIEEEVFEFFQIVLQRFYI